jgi:hypothetical protein
MRAEKPAKKRRAKAELASVKAEGGEDEDPSMNAAAGGPPIKKRRAMGGSATNITGLAPPGMPFDGSAGEPNMMEWQGQPDHPHAYPSADPGNGLHEGVRYPQEADPRGMQALNGYPHPHAQPYDGGRPLQDFGPAALQNFHPDDKSWQHLPAHALPGEHVYEFTPDDLYRFDTDDTAAVWDEDPEASAIPSDRKARHAFLDDSNSVMFLERHSKKQKEFCHRYYSLERNMQAVKKE